MEYESVLPYERVHQSRKEQTNKEYEEPRVAANSMGYGTFFSHRPALERGALVHRNSYGDLVHSCDGKRGCQTVPRYLEDRERRMHRSHVCELEQSQLQRNTSIFGYAANPFVVEHVRVGPCAALQAPDFPYPPGDTQQNRPIPLADSDIAVVSKCESARKRGKEDSPAPKALGPRGMGLSYLYFHDPNAHEKV